MTLSERRIVVGVGGGIAAFKAVELTRELQRRGAAVRVVMTPSAQRFVGAVTFTGITGTPPVVDLWDPRYPGEVHVELTDWADAVVVAPATANLMARAAAGIADDALLSTLSCADCPLWMAPAMHYRMWQSPANQRVVAQLTGDGVHFVGPVTGPLASGESGMGRMAEPAAIADAVSAEMSAAVFDLTGRKVLVTAGPTVEDVDPVRFLSNRSSGRMGYALAERAAARGAQVTLISGPVQLATPPGVRRIDVRSALQMHRAVMDHQAHVDAIVMTAAVADYRPAACGEHKLKKGEGDLHLQLVRNPDILAELGELRGGGSPVLIGFALETQDVVAHARSKLTRKRVDMVVANHAQDGFGGDDNLATLVGPDWDEALPRMPKVLLADRIWDRVTTWLEQRSDGADFAQP